MKNLYLLLILIIRYLKNTSCAKDKNKQMVKNVLFYPTLTTL